MKKINKAAAISYEMGEEAPKIIAKGKGIVADNIIKNAQEASVPVYKDDNLASMLTNMDIGDYIPEELYEIVAEILVFVDDLDRLGSKIRNAE